jgi:tellurite resistance protein
VAGFHLTTMDEIEASRLRRLSRRTGAIRRTRLLVGLFAACTAALATGAALGWATRQTREDLMTPQRPESTLDRVISSEVNRAILELWKMEDIEALGSRRRALQ